MKQTQQSSSEIARSGGLKRLRNCSGYSTQDKYPSETCSSCAQREHHSRLSVAEAVGLSLWLLCLNSLSICLGMLLAVNYLASNVMT